MKEQHEDIERMTRHLMKRSILSPESADFDDQLMQKIVTSPAPVELKPNGNDTRKAWRLWGLTIVCLIASIFIVSEFLTGYFKELSRMLTVTLNYVFYGGMALFIPFVLFQLDNLLQVNTWQKRKFTRQTS